MIIVYSVYLVNLSIYFVKSKTDFVVSHGGYSQIVEVTLEDLSNFENFDNAYIFFSREDCKGCKEIEPIINSYSVKNNRIIYKYNTIHDRRDNMEHMMDILSMYKIASVPAVAIIENSEYVKTIYEEEILSLP